jgi:hypothetical protein
MAPKLCDLPVELLDMIIDELPEPGQERRYDLKQVRFVCH